MLRTLRWAALAAGLVAPGLAAAADPVFPPGSSAGLVPPAGMTPSRAFTGFESPDKSSIVITEMPPEAYREVSGSFTPERLRLQGFTGAKQETLQVGGREAVLITGEQAASGITVRKWILVTASPETTALVVGNRVPGETAVSEADMRGAVLSVALRKTPDIEEQIAALPFKVGDRAGFRVVRQLGGSGLILTEGAKDIDPKGEQPSVFVVASLGAFARPSDLDAFARRALSGIDLVKDAKVETSRTSERGGRTVHELVASGTDPRNGQGVFVVQTIAFVESGPGASGYLRTFGIGSEAQRETLLPRFQRLAGSVAPRE